MKWREKNIWYMLTFIYNHKMQLSPEKNPVEKVLGKKLVLCTVYRKIKIRYNLNKWNSQNHLYFSTAYILLYNARWCRLLQKFQPSELTQTGQKNFYYFMIGRPLSMQKTDWFLRGFFAASMPLTCVRVLWLSADGPGCINIWKTMAGGSFVRLANFFAKYAKRLEWDRGEEGMARSAGVYWEGTSPTLLTPRLHPPIPPHHPLPQGGGGEGATEWILGT
jgi:hypothetical protein